jgi:hypothetical protein
VRYLIRCRAGNKIPAKIFPRKLLDSSRTPFSLHAPIKANKKVVDKARQRIAAPELIGPGAHNTGSTLMAILLA